MPTPILWIQVYEYVPEAKTNIHNASNILHDFSLCNFS